MTLLQKDIKKLSKLFKEIVVSDCEIEEYANELLEKSEDYYEKEKNERAEAYQEVSEALTELAEAYQNLYSTLCDHEVID